MARVVTVLRFMAHQSVRLSVAALGFTVLVVGLVLLVTPGPGLLVIIAGLAILAHEFAWAAKALDKAKRRTAQAREAAMRRAPRRAQPPTGNLD
ncbi:MAG: PGPGW domain-containing protein [Acidimicrobiales bacterium]